MRQAELRAGGSGDFLSGIGQETSRCGMDIKADGVGRHYRVKGAAVGDVELQRPPVAGVHHDLPREDEGGDGAKGDRAGPRSAGSLLDLHPGAYETARHLDRHLGFRLRRRHQARVDRPAAERHDGVAAHGRVALAMQEQDGEIGLRMVRLDRHSAIHLCMPTRLEHQEAAIGVVVGAGIAALVQQTAPLQLRIARGDDAQRFAAAVHLDGGDLEGAG
jgi:hypothetical protein